MAEISEKIDQKIGEIRTETLDMSFGEILSLHSQKELIIQPEYQRYFRWADEQKSRLVESILLGLPIPPIFVVENDDGVLELIDGLQRISSIIQFIEHRQIEQEEPLVLVGCDIVEDLNGKGFNDLPLVLKLRIKRSNVRMVIIKKQSNSLLRYEMFKRLNTGGSVLTPQEVRNCSVRMYGDRGIEFYDFLTECANFGAFKNCIATVSEADFDQRFDEELVLRFFAAKNAGYLFNRNVRIWLDSYLEKVLKGNIDFNYNKEKNDFYSVFTYLDKLMGQDSFVRYRNGSPIGSLAPAYYEAVSVGVFQCLDFIHKIEEKVVKNAIINKLMSDDFKRNIGPGSSKISSFRERISAIRESIQSCQ
ncbi:MAG: DUF262 domain-containing protein [Magnetococcus sp. DMHC-1]|nr:DUF262 domain-containing protein [Magnetococcales bacterium]